MTHPHSAGVTSSVPVFFATQIIYLPFAVQRPAMRGGVEPRKEPKDRDLVSGADGFDCIVDAKKVTEEKPKRAICESRSSNWVFKVERRQRLAVTH